MFLQTYDVFSTNHSQVPLFKMERSATCLYRVLNTTNRSIVLNMQFFKILLFIFIYIYIYIYIYVYILN